MYTIQREYDLISQKEAMNTSYGREGVQGKCGWHKWFTIKIWWGCLSIHFCFCHLGLAIHSFRSLSRLCICNPFRLHLYIWVSAPLNPVKGGILRPRLLDSVHNSVAQVLLNYNYTRTNYVPPQTTELNGRDLECKLSSLQVHLADMVHNMPSPKFVNHITKSRILPFTNKNHNKKHFYIQIE